MNKKYFYSAIFFILLNLLGVMHMAVANGTDDLDDAKDLFRMINHRLELMKDVAAYKYYNQMPSFIPGREQHVFADVKRVCDANGLEVEGVQVFIELQMRTAI